MEKNSKKFVCFGCGYTGLRLSLKLKEKGYKVYGSCTSDSKCEELESLGINSFILNEKQYSFPSDIFKDINYLLCSIPPNQKGDPFLRNFLFSIKKNSKNIFWAGYLSSTSVYGDHSGADVDEDSETKPSTGKGENRLRAEQQWTKIYKDYDIPVHIFRLAAIYGPNRNYISRLKAGLNNLTICKGQWFSRIHVDDIVTILESSMNKVNPGSVYNVCDEHPTQVDEIIEYCSKIMNIELPKMTFYDKHSFPRNKKIFFTGNKKVRSKKILSELKVNLKYPSYKEGLLSLLNYAE